MFNGNVSFDKDLSAAIYNSYSKIISGVVNIYGFVIILLQVTLSSVLF